MTAAAVKHVHATSRYTPPDRVVTTTINEAIAVGGRTTKTYRAKASSDLFGGERDPAAAKIWYAGDIGLLKQTCVAIVGSRQVSAEGAARARRLAKELSAHQIVIVSGLAYGVDTHALAATVAHGGKTIAVIGTPIDKCTPLENAPLQEEIYTKHLLVSQFEPGSRVYPSNFPVRNRLMAALSDATVIIEATDDSGTLHQAVECTNLGRWLFIARSLFNNPKVKFPHDFLRYERCIPLDTADDILKRVRPTE